MVGRLWKYNRLEGTWKDNGEDFLKSVLRKDLLINKHRKINYVNEIIADVKQYKYEEKYFKEPPAHLVAFNNKIYDLKNDESLDFDPKYFFVNKIPVNIDTGNKTCPLIDSMFELFVGPDRKIDLYELAAYCLYRKYPNAKFFLLAGDGRNGKSTYINLLEMLVGDENRTSVSLKSITSDKFSAQSLDKKLLSVSTELDPIIIRNTALMKKLTGRDSIRAEKKYGDEFHFVNYAKLVIVANEKITTTDKTYGFGRRVKIINFITVFEEGKSDNPDILDEVTQDELEGFAHVCLQTLKALYKRKFVFSIAQDQEEVKELYDKNTQILNEFLKQNIMLDPESYIFTVEFYEAFTEYLRELKVAFWSEKMLIEEMKSLGYERKQKRIVNDGLETSRPCWPGFKWNK
ncbi:MAG: phage/plasmid primase, P4 family [Cyanobacteria bacterium]|nr:phage/plasmid primase, P4 family [Cyanobacteriota bacterium]